jgi:hypothetical protein
MSNGFEWINTPEDVFIAGYDAWTGDIKEAIYQLAQRFVIDIVNWMKENAPWTDRTGNLRQSLWADVAQRLNEISISFDYGLYYGVFLEFKHQGRYAIIAPALDHFAPLWVQAVQELLR